jgi:hypothetical protein
MTKKSRDLILFIYMEYERFWKIEKDPKFNLNDKRTMKSKFLKMTCKCKLF